MRVIAYSSYFAIGMHPERDKAVFSLYTGIPIGRGVPIQSWGRLEGGTMTGASDCTVAAGIPDHMVPAGGPAGCPDSRTDGRAFRPLRRGIAWRLLAFILLFSTIVTLLATAAQLYVDYRRDVDAIERRLNEIEISYLGSLAGSLWRVDVDQVSLQLQGMLRLPDMQSLEVRETMETVASPVIVRVGQRAAPGQAVIAREFPIIYSDRGQKRNIGVLYAEATLSEVYGRLTRTAVTILVSQGIKTFLVSLFTLYIVHRLVTRHLISIARYVGNYDIHAPAPALRLDRHAPRNEDELDRMVAAFNAMCVTLERAYDDLRTANNELERDIVARKEAEQEIIRLNAQLEQRVKQRTVELEAANNELASFSYSVSHDLRAPLRRIDGFGRILQEECGESLNDRARHCLDRISSGTREMAEMIDSFLRLSRSTRGELTIETVDLSAMASSLAEHLAERDAARLVEMTIQPGLVVEGDRRLLNAALTNLLENAWKYTRDVAQAAVTFGTQEIDGRTAYFVRDNGAGFDMAFADRLFMPFSRLHKVEDFEGTGIGLATVQRIIARHGGRVWGEGHPGQGAVFFFTLWEEKASGERAENPAGRG